MNNRTIYIADDDKNLLQLYSSIFDSKDDDELDFFDDDEVKDEFEVKMFEDGFYLVEEFQKNYSENRGRIPVAILDMRMPKMGGFETAKKIKDIDPNTIIIVITAYSDVAMSEIRLQLKNGVYYFKKPFNEEELYSLVDTVLKHWNEREKNIELQNSLKEMNETLETKVEQAVEENRKKDATIVKQQRLAYIGEVLSNVAHHWRQPLNHLALLIQELNEGYKYGELEQDYFEQNSEEMLNIVNYMSKTIDDFRDFFAPNETETIFSIEKAIEHSKNTFNKEFNHDSFEIEFKIDKELKVRGFLNEFSRVISSIIENSREAIERNKIHNPELKLWTEKKEGKIILNFIDNAGGVSEEMLDKIFDPYSTVKDQTRGTGLGLFFCKIVIENHMNGTIEVNNVDEGFHVALIFKEQSN
jgi:signal transduction histidine kinase